MPDLQGVETFLGSPGTRQMPEAVAGSLHCSLNLPIPLPVTPCFQALCTHSLSVVLVLQS